jgi:hypothetical protein
MDPRPILLGMRSPIYPCRVTVLARRELKNPLESREWGILLLGQLNGDIGRGRPSCGIVARSEGPVFSHAGIYQARELSATFSERQSIFDFDNLL